MSPVPRNRYTRLTKYMFTKVRVLTVAIAYSLLGIFGVNMSLLYGEGSRAFDRLQSEILKTSDDETIFAWLPKEPLAASGLLAPTIRWFDQNRFFDLSSSVTRSHYEETNKGLRLNLWLSRNYLDERLPIWTSVAILVPLDCDLYPSPIERVGGQEWEGQRECMLVQIERESDISGLTKGPLVGSRVHGINPVFVSKPPWSRPLRVPEGHWPSRPHILARPFRSPDSDEVPEPSEEFELYEEIDGSEADVPIYFKNCICLDAARIAEDDLIIYSESTYGSADVLYRGRALSEFRR